MVSPFWQTVIGAAAAIVGGLVAAMWQTSHGEKIARSIRRAERRERGLLDLNTKVADVLARIDPLYRQAERGQTQFQYQEAIRILGELSAHWNSDASGVISDGEVINAYNELNGAIHEGLPRGSSYAPYMATLQSGDKDAAQRFVRDLGRVLMLLGELKKVVQAQVQELQGIGDRKSWARRTLDAAGKRVQKLRKSLGRAIAG